MARTLLGYVNRLKDAFEESSIMEMRKISNDLIEQAALENSKEKADVALIGYSLHKLSSKQHIVEHGKWEAIRKRVIAALAKGISALEKGNRQGFEAAINGIVKEITSTDMQMGNFVQGIHEKAMVKYAASAYSMGLSISKAAELTGADHKKVLEYVGATRISDREAGAIGIGERLNKLKKGLGLK